MSKTKTMNRTDMMLNQPINKVIPHLAVPTIISMLITTVYNMADTFFVSKIGTSASGSVGIIFSAMSMIQALAFTIGMGSGVNLSQSLGAGDEKRANTYVSTGFYLAFAVGVLIAVLALTNINWLVRFLGATETIAPYAVDYATYIFYATPFMMCSLVMNNHLRYEGLSLYSMLGITTGGILNMVLDPLFIFTFRLGVAGAAIATALSQLVSFLILLAITFIRPEAIRIRIKNISREPGTYGRIILTGLPSMGRQGLASVSTIILNKAAGVYGDAAIAAISIMNRYVMFINSSVVGFGQGFQPVCAFCYGAGKYSRVKKSFWYCVKVTSVILLVLGAVSMLASSQIIAAFRDDPEVISIGTHALRLQLCSIPLLGFMTMSNMFTQSIGRSLEATVIASARQGIFLIPALLILPRLWGLEGILIAQPISDVLTTLLAWVLVRKVAAALNAMPDSE